MFRTVQLVVAAIPFLASGCRSSCCEDRCHGVWTENGYNGRVQFQNTVAIDGVKSNHRVEWKWKSEKGRGTWNAFYTETSNGVKSGGFHFAPSIQRKPTFLSWKLYNETLTWASKKEKIRLDSWNVTICGLGLRMYFRSDDVNWTYQIGNIKIGGGESGTLHVNGSFFEPHTTEHNLQLSTQLVRRRREAEDLEEDKKNVWNKLKKWFKELFDQGPDDPRGWMTRIADWLLGLLERILS